VGKSAKTSKATKSKRVTRSKRFEELNIPVLVLSMMAVVAAVAIVVADGRSQRMILGLSSAVTAVAIALMAIKVWYAKK
jgi:hypothetical protein